MACSFSNLLGLGLVVGLTAGQAACVADYEDSAPPGLEDVPAIDLDGQGDDDELVYERELRWWVAPVVQRARLFRRVDGTYVLLRQRSIGTQVYGWAEATLTAVGQARLDAALASADPTRTQPAPGVYDCTYVDALPAVIYLDDEVVEYLSLCPPEGLTELAELFEDVVELMLDCPLDGDWYDGDLPLTQLDCEVAE